MNEAFFVALGSLLTAVAASAGVVLSAVWKYQKERRDQVLEEWKAVVNRQGEELAHLRHVCDEQQSKMNQIHAEHARCEVEMSELYAWVQRYYDGCNERDAVLKRLAPGHEPSPMPPPPQRRGGMDRSDFLVRTSQQDVALARGSSGAGGAGGQAAKP